MTTPYQVGPVLGRRKHAQDRLATGNPVYGMGGSNAATIGTVDPTGYVERGRRSGLAASLLARTKLQQPPGGDPAGQAPGGDGQAGAQLVGQTTAASPVPPGDLVRRLAARMSTRRGV